MACYTSRSIGTGGPFASVGASSAVVGSSKTLCRSARLSQATARDDGSAHEHVSGRLVFAMIAEAWRFLRTPAGLVWPDTSDKLDVYQEPGTW